MLTALLPIITSGVVSISAGVAVDSAVKLITPIGLKTVPAFGLKLATSIASSVVGFKLGAYVEKNVADVISTVAETDAEVPQDEN